MIHSRRAAALCLLALAFSAAPAARLGRTVFERVDARSATFFRFGLWSPGGQELADQFGPRVTLGVEARAVSRYGVGAGVGLDGWWASREEGFSYYLPVSVSAFYCYPLLDSAVTPFAGLFATVAYGSFCLPHAHPDSISRVSGMGGGGGAMLGVEVPLMRNLTTRFDMRLGGGSISAAPRAESWVDQSERRRVKTGNFSATLGLTMGYNDLFFW